MTVVWGGRRLNKYPSSATMYFCCSPGVSMFAKNKGISWWQMSATRPVSLNLIPLVFCFFSLAAMRLSSHHRLLNLEPSVGIVELASIAMTQCVIHEHQHNPSEWSIWAPEPYLRYHGQPLWHVDDGNCHLLQHEHLLLWVWWVSWQNVLFNVNTYSSKVRLVIHPPKHAGHFIWRSSAASVEEGLSQVGVSWALGPCDWLVLSCMWAVLMAFLTLLLTIVFSMLYHWTTDVNPCLKGSWTGLPCGSWWVFCLFLKRLLECYLVLTEYPQRV